MIHNYEKKNEHEQKRIQESLNRPASMLEDLKSNWNEMFLLQTSQMRDMIQNSLNDALSKRKEERKSNKKSKEDSVSEGGIKDQRLQYYKERVDEFQDKFQ